MKLEEAMNLLREAGLNEEIVDKVQNNRTLAKKEFVDLQTTWNQVSANKDGFILVVGYNDD